MTAIENRPRPTEGTPQPRNKKTEAIIAILSAIIGGGIAGVLHRVIEEVSYYESLKTAGGTTGGLLIVIFVVLTYIWS
ncbi:hypothetical protein [Streptomyces sp. MS2.AVA.5]|uniref:Uncharacterized protein n=1 Tax=Streptomyces achmelvichensis TaxID=3134111 RepID=A0ACC6PLB3_9ACTN